MSFEEERRVIEKHFLDNWVFTPIDWVNVKLDFQKDSEFVRLKIINLTSEQIDLGVSQQNHRHTGIVSIDVFTPTAIGTSKARKLCDLIIPIFRQRRVSNIQFKVPSIKSIGTYGGFFQMNVSIPFVRDEFVFL